MKARKKIISFIGIVVLIAITSLNVNLKSDSKFPLITFANIEALGNSEIPDPLPSGITVHDCYFIRECLECPLYYQCICTSGGTSVVCI